MQHFNITVSGYVQGVGFRFATQKTAQQLKIKGFALNKPDGTVYIEAEGEMPDINNFIRWCHIGPSYAHVSGVKTTEGELKNFTSFTIKH